jgi:hypothetical protein
VPLDQQVRVVREQGTWKVCPTALVPGPSGIPLPSNMAPAAS